MAADTWWISMGRELARLLEREKQLENELEVLYGQRHALVEQLVDTFGQERDADGDRLSLLRVPAWASERQEQFVQPGHGASTYPLSELEHCPGMEHCPYAEGGAHAAAEHLHVRGRGVVNIVG